MARTPAHAILNAAGMARARKRGFRWEAQFRFGGYWHPVKRTGRVVTYKSADAARTAALKALPSIIMEG